MAHGWGRFPFAYGGPTMRSAVRAARQAGARPAEDNGGREIGQDPSAG